MFTFESDRCLEILNYLEDESLSIIDIYSKKKFPDHKLPKILDITAITKNIIKIVIQL